MMKTLFISVVGLLLQRCTKKTIQETSPAYHHEDYREKKMLLDHPIPRRNETGLYKGFF